ncbi:MAG: long-chain fatty acid--CoA ligase [Nitrospirae bacterium]|nr:long-chain fatty acid--CoA ligase [Nitrospirota bacterium]
MTLSALLTERAKEYPEKACIKFEERTLTYSETDRTVSLTAGGLKETGLGSGDRAAILMENCPEYIISYFSIIRAGSIAVPLNNFLTAHEIFYILKDSGCRILIYGDKFSAVVSAIKEDLPDITCLRFNEIPQRQIPQPLGDEDDVAVFLYTSGTTGFPKGAMLTHKNLLSDAEACIMVMKVSEKDRILLFLPLFHSFTFTVCVIAPIYAGARIVLLQSVRPFSKIINSIFKDRVTLFVAVPAVYNILIRKKMPFMFRFFLKYLINIRACVSGASALPEDTLYAFEKRFRIPLIEGYGLTEASPVVSVNPLRGLRKKGSAGLPIVNVEAAIAGENGEMLGRNEVGELIVKGPNIMKGYYNKEDETKEVLKDGWLYTGDMARIDEDGYIYIVDRKKDLIIVDGMNVYPREVEDIVIKHPSVEECAMVGIPDNKGSEFPVLFIKRKENTGLTEKEIKESLKGDIAQFKTPRRVIFLEEFPKTATGKIKKAELRKIEVK